LLLLHIPFSNASADSAASFPFLLTSIILDPAEAKPAAIANPRPFEPPVMIAACPLRSKSLTPGNWVKSVGNGHFGLLIFDM